MGKILEADLIIKGTDKTGGAFAGVIAHARELMKTLGGMKGLGLNEAKLKEANAQLRQGTALLRSQNSAWRQINSSIALGNRELEQRSGLMRRMAGRFGGMMGNAGYMLGPGVLYGTMRGIKSGAQIQSQKVHMQAAGIPDAEIDAMSTRGGDLAQRYPNVGLAEILERYKELRSVLAHKEETPHLIGPAIQAASALKALGLSTEGLPFAFKTAEVQGLAQDPKRFTEFLDSYVKAVQVMGATITPEAMLRGAQQLKASAALLSDRFKNTTYLSMLQDMGTRAGAGVNAAVAEVIGNFQGQHSAAKQFVSLGLAREEDFEKTKTGEIMGLKPGRHIKDWQLASRDLDQYVWQKLVPSLTAHGYTTQEQQISEVMRLFPYKRASDVIAKLIQQEPSFEQHAQLYGAARGLSAVDLIRRDAIPALGSLTESLTNFAGVLTSPSMLRAAEIMSDTAHVVGGWSSWLQEWQKRHPLRAEVYGAGAAGGGLIAGGAMLYGLFRGVFSGFGLKGSAAALDASAAQLSAAAARLGGGQAVGAGSAAAVAGGSMLAAGAVAASVVAGGTALSKVAADIVANNTDYFLKDIGDFGIGANIMNVARKHADMAAEELTAAGRRRITVDDIHSALYGGGEAPKAEITGSADIRVKVEAGDGLIAKIESVANRVGEYLHINGAPPNGTSGSTGGSMPEAAPGAYGP